MPPSNRHMSGKCCNIKPNAVDSNTSAPTATSVNIMTTNWMQMKPAPGSRVIHGFVGPSPSQQLQHNLRMKNVMLAMSRKPSASAQPVNGNLQAGGMHCANSNVAGSSNGKQQHLPFRKSQNVDILPPTLSSIRDLEINNLYKY